MTKSILLFIMVFSGIVFSSCRKKAMTKESNIAYEPLATKPNTTIEYNYEIFDSCRVTYSWTPSVPPGPASRGIRYPYIKQEIVGFDTLKPNTCIIRDELSKRTGSIKDSVYSNYNYRKFPSDFGGAPTVYITFKGDSIFIESIASQKYNSGGCELRGVRKK